MARPDYHRLHRGDTLPPFDVRVTAEQARAYLDATGEDPASWDGIVPPLAIGALLLAGLMDEVPLPDGAVHAGQEFEFVSPLAPEEAMQAHFSIAQQSVRQGSNIVVFHSELRATGERVVLRGKTTIIAPVPEGAASL